MNSPLLIPMYIHIALTGFLYLVVSLMRAPKVWQIGIAKDGTNPFAAIEPRVSANLANQFEWPLFFYVICVLLITNDSLYQPPFLWLAWAFVVGRILHSLVQILTTNVRLRGVVFTLNFLAVLLMWGLMMFT